MVTAHQIKVLQSLNKKKFRQKYKLFLVEGNKTIEELKDSNFTITTIYTTTPDHYSDWETEVVVIDDRTLKKMSHLVHPKDSIAVVQLEDTKLEDDYNRQLVLDGIQDPGNMGTLIRLADWFGIQQIICSKDTVDFYNPKVIQSSMGSFTRVNIVYTDLPEFLKNTKNKNCGTDMEGENIYTSEFPKHLNLILGNEGNGIREDVEKCLDISYTIPRFGKNKATESLNVSVAGSIILGEIYSRLY